MGTRSLTRVIPRQDGLSFNKGHLHPEKAMVNMYRQFDGYPDGHGIDLAEFLKDIKIVNGIPLNKESGNQANGSGCLAAQMVKHFKEDIGYIYLHPHDNESGWEDYIYTVYPKIGEETFISIYDVNKERCIFVGTPYKLIDKYKEKEVPQ